MHTIGSKQCGEQGFINNVQKELKTVKSITFCMKCPTNFSEHFELLFFLLEHLFKYFIHADSVLRVYDSVTDG